MNKREMEGEGGRDDRGRDREGVKEVSVKREGGCWQILPALHGSLTVSPMFALFVGEGEANTHICAHTVTRQYTDAYVHPQVHTTQEQPL